MPPRLLLAPAGHGKTEHIIRRIRQVNAEEPLAPVTVVVPNTIRPAGSASGWRLLAARWGWKFTPFTHFMPNC